MIARRAEIAAALAEIVPGEGVIVSEIERRAFESEVGAGVQEGVDHTLVLIRRDRARRVDKHPSRTEGPCPGGEDWHLHPGQLRE